MKALVLAAPFVVVLVLACHGADPAASDDESPQSDAAPPQPDLDAAVVSTSCSGLAAQPRDRDWTIQSDGRTRTFRVHVPPSYDTTSPTPLVVSFHGLTGTAAQQQGLSRMNELADEAGFVVVYPQGVSNSWNAGTCCGTATSSNVDDVGFVDDLLDAVAAELCIDPARVYATGMSNGGHMSYRLACELADRFAAIAPVAGVDKNTTCAPARRIPIMHFHGTLDLIVPYSGSLSSTAAWAQRNGCRSTRTQVFANGDSACEAYDGCPAGAEVVLCTVDGGGHTWPGGQPVIGLGETTNDLSATRAMWEFWTGE